MNIGHQRRRSVAAEALRRPCRSPLGSTLVDPVAPDLDDTEQIPAPVTARRGSGVARNTAIFSIATGLSRIAGLIREVVARSYFGTSGAASAFTLAFQLPNLVRSLFADAALSAAFVPVFTEMLEENRKKDAF